MSMVNREKRKNAGRRMGGLVGKAMEEEEDDAFWSHETWDDDADSGNDSFHESDEDSVLKKDVFDSDFDDSESDNEKDEAAAGEAEELELQKSERAKRRQKSSTNYIDAAKSSSTLGFRGKKGVANKRAVGEGYNAGILLNFPSNSSDSLAQSTIGTLQSTNKSTSLQSIIDTKNATVAAVNNLPEHLPAFNTFQTENVPSSKNLNRGTDPFIRSSRVSLRERRSTQGVRKIRENHSTPSRRFVTVTAATTTIVCTGRSKSSSSVSNSRTTAKRKRHSQEELLLEAIHETEPENQRWLFGRKRVQDQHEKDKDLNSGLRDKYRGKKIIQKFHSRRGCLNTLTFPEMDSVPEILTRRQSAQNQTQHHQPQQHYHGNDHESQTATISSSSSERAPQQRSSVCVITGKPSKYKDPLTNMPYHDLAAFKELRKRYENGIPILKNSKSRKNSCDGEGIKNNRQATNKNSTLSGVNNGIKPVTRIYTIDGKSIRKNTDKIAPPVKKSFPSNFKLPFQSPKPPSRPTTISTALQSQQENPPQLPTFSLSRKDTLTTTKAVTSIDSSLSVSGRRLSPRKRKLSESEKNLETICMSPGNNNPSPSSSTMEKLGIAATRTTTPPEKTHSGNIDKIINNSGQSIKYLKESVFNENSNKEPKAVWDSAVNVPHERQSTAEFKPKQAASVAKIVSIQPTKAPSVREAINIEKPVSSSVTLVARSKVNRTISTANCNGFTQKIISATATTIPPTDTSDNSSSNIDSSKIEENNIRNDDPAVTESTNKFQVLSKGQAIAKEEEEKEEKKNEACDETPIDNHKGT